jgi:hypothetical protein
VNPFDLLMVGNLFENSVKGVAYQAVDSLDSGGDQCLD